MNCTMLMSMILFAAEPTPNWLGFLGTGATPIDPQTIPLRWSPTENLAWSRTIVGYGQSSPVIWGDQVFVTAVDGDKKQTLHIVCVSLKDGAVVWDHASPSSFPQKNSVDISRAAPTPVVDEKGVYAYFESGDVVALSHDGKPRWSRSLSRDYGPPQNEFGLSASPVQASDRIMILHDDPGPSYVLALEKATGNQLWKTDRTSRKSWTSPALIPFGETVQLVASSAGSVTSYEPKSGRLLWEFTGVSGNTGTTPIAVGDGAFLVSASSGREVGNPDEVKKSNGLMYVAHDGAEWFPRFIWTNPIPTPWRGSPIMHHDYAYWVSRTGVICCLEIVSGQIAYVERLKQSCWATPIGIGERVYLFGKDGLTTVIAAGDDFQVLAENSLWPADQPPANNAPSSEDEPEEQRQSAKMSSRPTVYGVAVVNGSLIVRTGSQLFCLRK